MDPNLRNLKDFLTLYNKITQLCFTRCVDSLFERDLTNTENACVEECVTKFALFNQKMMSVYVEVQTDINQKRLEEQVQLTAVPDVNNKTQIEPKIPTATSPTDKLTTPLVM